ncbi:hypothetical protein IZ6_22470 [Terrihabitans soli]|uniref:Uncharacterized protein n=1 Tax=Terrihabitans soli TaxID=708113 RepID=A0A6S6QW88_9HYPH|nr:hypothetical protein IZ6_22470 [Terrihabitans soli]
MIVSSACAAEIPPATRAVAASKLAERAIFAKIFIKPLRSVLGRLRTAPYGGKGQQAACHGRDALIPLAENRLLPVVRKSFAI